MAPASLAHLYAFITVAIWSTAYVGTKIASASFSPGGLGVLRIFAATGVLIAVAAARKLAPPRLRDWPAFALTGLCGIALYQLLFTKGFADIGPTTSCVIIAASPVFSAVLAYFVFRERLSAWGWASIALAFCGILVMALWDGSMTVNLGVVWTALASILFAVSNLLQRGLSRSYGSLAVNAYGFIAAALLLSPFLPDAVREMRVAPASHTAIVVLLGVFCSAIAFLFWVKALSLAVKTSYVTNYMFVTPFLSTVLELVVLRQWPDAGTILGGAIIMASLVIFALAGKYEK